MKRILALLLLASVGVANAGYYAQLPKLIAQKKAEMLAKNIDLSKVPEAYRDSVAKLKESVPTLVKSAAVLVPKLIGVGTQAASGGLSGLATGAISFVSDSASRDAIAQLVPAIVNTVDAARTLANADPSTKQTVRNLILAVKQDADVQKVMGLPVVGGLLNQLFDTLTSL